MPNDTSFTEKRCTERFPLHLPVAVAGELGARCGQTCDMSSGGVLFYMDSEVEVGSPIQFTVSMPGEALGSEKDVSVNCTGRVARCAEENGRHVVAVIIDEYQFERV
jgi:hypothetical protein